MFRTVRHWWSDGSGQHTARLFLFEFVVVVAGVLVAQGLANWVQDRAEQRQGHVLFDKVIDRGRRIEAVANYWHLHGPCLRDHVDRIARSVSGGPTMTMAEVGRPGLPTLATGDFSEDDWRKIHDVAGNPRFMALQDMLAMTDPIERYSIDISDQWATFKLLDTSIGPASSDDRARVRLATAIIDNRLRWLIFNVDQSKRGLRKIGLAPSSDLPVSERMVDRCGLLKDWH